MRLAFSFLVPLLVQAEIVQIKTMDSSNNCLEIAGQSGSVALGDCDKSGSQLFELVQKNAGYMFKNVVSGKCLDLAGAKVDNGAPVVTYWCSSVGHQILNPVNGRNSLQFEHSNKCLATKESANGGSASFIQQDCNNRTNQRFQMIPQLYQLSTFMLSNLGMCMSIKKESKSRGATIHQYKCLD